MPQQTAQDAAAQVRGQIDALRSQIRSVQSAAIPQNQDELNALRDQRTELLGQQHELTKQRAELVAQMNFAPGDQKSQLQARVATLDARSASIDQQLAGINDRISTAIGRGVESRSADAVPTAPIGPINIPRISIPPFAFQQRNTARDLVGPLAIEAGTFLLVALVLWQVGWRRMRRQLTQVIGDQSARMQQLQQAVDVIGVEVERISEGQRYVAKVLADGKAAAPAVRAGDAR